MVHIIKDVVQITYDLLSKVPLHKSNFIMVYSSNESYNHVTCWFIRKPTHMEAHVQDFNFPLRLYWALNRQFKTQSYNIPFSLFKRTCRDLLDYIYGTKNCTKAICFHVETLLQIIQLTKYSRACCGSEKIVTHKTWDKSSWGRVSGGHKMAHFSFSINIINTGISYWSKGSYFWY